MRNLERDIARAKAELERTDDTRRMTELLTLLHILKDERLEQLAKDYVTLKLKGRYCVKG